MFEKLKNVSFVQKTLFAISFIIIAAYTSTSLGLVGYAIQGQLPAAYQSCLPALPCKRGNPLDVDSFTAGSASLLGAFTASGAGQASVGVDAINYNGKVGEARNDQDKQNQYKASVVAAGKKWKMDPKNNIASDQGLPNLAQKMKALKTASNEAAVRMTQGLVARKICNSTIQNCEINELAMGVKLGLVTTQSLGIPGSQAEKIIGMLQKEYDTQNYADNGFFMGTAHASSGGGNCGSPKVATNGSIGVGQMTAKMTANGLDLANMQCGTEASKRTAAALYGALRRMKWAVNPQSGIEANLPAAAAQVSRAYETQADNAASFLPKAKALAANMDWSQAQGDPVFQAAGKAQQDVMTAGQQVHKVTSSDCETGTCTLAESGDQIKHGMAYNSAGQTLARVDNNADPATTSAEAEGALGDIGGQAVASADIPGGDGGGGYGDGAGGGGGIETGELYVPPKTLVSGLSLKDIFGPNASPATMLSQNTR